MAAPPQGLPPCRDDHPAHVDLSHIPPCQVDEPSTEEPPAEEPPAEEPPAEQAPTDEPELTTPTDPPANELAPCTADHPAVPDLSDLPPCQDQTPPEDPPPADEPPVEELPGEEPLVEQPLVEQQPAEEPAAEEPAAEEPAAEEPAAEEPAAEEPAAEEPELYPPSDPPNELAPCTADHPAVPDLSDLPPCQDQTPPEDPPPADEPPVEELPGEEPLAEQPLVEQQPAEEPPAEPPAEEPAAKEPAAELAPTDEPELTTPTDLATAASPDPDSSGTLSPPALPSEPTNQDTPTTQLELTTRSGDVLTIDLSSFATDGSVVTALAYTTSSNGTLSVQGVVATYIPAPGFYGVDRFTLRVCHPSAACLDVLVSVIVPPINDFLLTTGAALSQFLSGGNVSPATYNVANDLLSETARRVFVPLVGLVTVAGASLMFGLDTVGNGLRRLLAALALKS